MKPILWLAAITAAAPMAVYGQFEFANGKLWATAEERARVEYRANNIAFNNDIRQDTDVWLLQRLRAGLGVKPLDWLKLYGELQDSREIGSTRYPLNTDLEEDRLDWRQGWIEVGNGNDFPLLLKVGRQTLGYGEERLIGAFDWNNIGRVFDAAKLRWQADKWWVDAFGANVVNNNVTSSRDGTFDDRADWADDFFGLYGQCRAMDKHVWELYALLRNKTDAAYQGPARRIYTLGARLASTEKLAPWDYYVEFAGQFGHIQGGGGSYFGETNTTAAVQRAFAGTIGAGYTFSHDWKPRLALEYNYASGDRNPNDGVNETFDNLFPTNHKFYGFEDFFAWKNVHNPHALFAVTPLKNLKLQLDGHLFWLAQKEDAWYRASQTAVRRSLSGAAGRFVGSEMDLTASYTVNKHLKLLAGYSRFFCGSFVSRTGAHDDADFVYVQVTLGL